MKKFVLSLLLATMALSGYARPALATIGAPSSTPTISQTKVFRNLLETGDSLYIFIGDIPYTVTPDEPVTSTYFWQLLSVDASTILGTTTGYVYQDNGYGPNVYSFYFPASAGLVWGSAYWLRLQGNPAQFTTPPTYSFPLSSADYSVLTLSADEQAELAALVLSMAHSLDVAWGLTGIYSLLSSQDTRECLSLDGQVVFRGSVYGLQAFAPLAFPLVVTDITITDRAWNTDYSSNLTNQYSGTWVDAAIAAGKDFLAVDFNLFGLLLTLALCGAVLIANVYIASDVNGGLMDATVVAIMMTRIGQIELTYIILIAAVAVFWISARLWGVLRV